MPKPHPSCAPIIGAALFAAIVACSADRVSAPRASPPAEASFSVVCPPQYSGCAQLDTQQVRKIQDMLDDIDEASNYNLECGFIRETIEELLYAASPRLSFVNTYPYSGWSDPDNDWTIALPAVTFADENELFWTLIHEARHVRYETHGSSGYFENETDFINNGCVDYQDES